VLFRSQEYNRAIMKYKHPPIYPGARPSSQLLLDFLISFGPAFWNWTAVPLGPALALLYNVAAALFLVGWNEGTFQQHVPSIVVRTAVLLLSLAAAKALTDLHAPMIFGTVPVFMWTFMIGAYSISRTRLYVVEGVEPKLERFCMRGKVVIVTGANTGIGLETTRRLVKEGARVIMACRSEENALEAMEEIKEYYFKRRLLIDDSQLIFVPLDLADFASVRNAANTVLQMDLPSLDCLINNAGIMMGEKKLSKDGNELCMQANYLGHFLFTTMLLSKLEENPGARVLNITSSTYAIADKGMDFDDLMCEKTRKYTLFGQYAQSKLANILFTKELAKRHDKLRSYAIHPGLVRTDVVRNMPAWLYYPNIVFGFIVASLQKMPVQGAYTSIWAACTNNPPANGSYLVNSKATTTNSFATNEAQAIKLWNLSEELVGLIK